ncbi:MAG: flagellar hook-associated protein FlgK [Thauera sp.]|nr:flagellar hook-associated protein FlgK [Thauera sp.]
MSSLLNIGLTGLSASQAYLNTTSHNIANAATPGFHRQNVTQEARDPQYRGGAFFGTGTGVTGVERSYSQLLEGQVLSADSRRAEYAAYSQFVSQLDNVLADADTGLTPALNEFFGALQNVTSNPTNVAARQALISSGETLSARFRTLDGRISEISEGIETEMRSTLESINGYAAAIAELNQRIVSSRAGGAGSAANDLLDQRDQAIAELNRLVKVSTVAQRDGTLSVFIGSGQSLVMGNRAKQLELGDQLDENGRSMIMVRGSSGAVEPLAESLVGGGTLGGLLAARREGTASAQRSLGLLATTLATEFNNQHALGLDLEGRLGGEFFKIGGVRVDPPDSGVSVRIDPQQVSALTGSDYSLRYDGTTYQLIDLATGDAVPAAQMQVTTSGGTSTIKAHGLIFTAAAGAPTESAFVYPTRYTAGAIEVAIRDPRAVAAAAPVLASLATGEGSSLRIEQSGLLSRGSAAAGTELGLPALKYAYDAVDKRFELDAAAPAGWPATLDYDPANSAAGKSFTLEGPDGITLELKISGTPAANDLITLADNQGGVADNRNAALLGALQTDKLMFGSGGEPTATINNAYAQLVAKVGSKTREVQAGERTQTSLLQQATASRDAVSGVNLDEEAANLVRFQQSYQAAAKVMGVAQRLFDEMLAIAR